jgi:hypothetical protein
MIAGIFHNGSGLGNQLHRYVMTRVLAMDKGFDWGMIDTGNFKGHQFLNLDMGSELDDSVAYHEFYEKRVNNAHGVDIRDYDWEGINNIRDHTIIDGEFQGEKYYEHHRDKIDSWLAVEPLDLGDNVCIINFRGGEYIQYPDLFLTYQYWERAIEKMREINPHMVFRVVTDDVDSASIMFPHFEIQHEMAKDWRSIRYAKYLILSNSSFAILPAWLNKEAYIIAPWGWARHNIGYWALEQNKMKGWNYLKTDGTYEIYT